jgi:hypothetical protein
VFPEPIGLGGDVKGVVSAFLGVYASYSTWSVGEVGDKVFSAATKVALAFLDYIIEYVYILQTKLRTWLKT